MLEITAFERPHDYGQYFKDKYGPTIATQANARKNGREDEFLEAVDRFWSCTEWYRYTAAAGVACLKSLTSKVAAIPGMSSTLGTVR